MALFGASSGPVPLFDLTTLNAKGSLFVTRPSLAHHLLTREETAMALGDVLGWLDSGKLKLRIPPRVSLADAPRRTAIWKAARPRQAAADGSLNCDDSSGQATLGTVLLVTLVVALISMVDLAGIHAD